MTALLDDDTIEAIHKAATDLGLDRDGLLAGLPRSFVGTLQKASNPSATLLLDLTTFNETPSLEGGKVPMKVWLRNAVTLGGPRTQVAAFKAALALLPGAQDPLPPPPPPPPPPLDGSSSFLDERPYPLERPEAQELLKLLKSAYSSRDQATFVAACCGVDLDGVEVVGAVGPLWQGILRAAASQGKLRKLVDHARSDRSIAGFHGALARLVG